jgi:hypothetical protein
VPEHHGAQVHEQNLQLLSKTVPGFQLSSLYGPSDAPTWLGIDELVPFWMNRKIMHEHRLRVVSTAVDLRGLIFDSESPKSPEVVSLGGGPPALFMQGLQHFFVEIACQWARLPNWQRPARQVLSGRFSSVPALVVAMVSSCHQPQPWQNDDLHTFEVVPWKLSGRPGRDGHYYDFEAKMRLHFKVVTGSWSMRIMKADFTPSRVVCGVLGDHMYPMMIELVTDNQEDADRFDKRRLHLVRMTAWPRYVQEAMDVPGRSVFNRGRWEPMVGGRPAAE